MATKKNCHGVSHPHVSNITITKDVGITSELKYKSLFFVDTLFTMASEETPLLSTVLERDIYLRFSSTKKNIILLMVSGCGLINRKFTCSTLLGSAAIFTIYV